jgi:hypothetical protein
MWKGKPYQTNVKGETAKAWNSPELKKVGSGWPTSESASSKKKASKVNKVGSIYGNGMSESVSRIRELAGLDEMVDDSDDQVKVDDMAADMSADAVDEMVKHDHEDDMTADMTIEDLMRKYGVDESVSEAAQHSSVDPKTLVRDIVSAVRDMYEDQGFVGSGDQHEFETWYEFLDFLEMNELETFAQQLEELSDADKNRVFHAAMKRINKILAGNIEEDAPLVGMPFTSLGATNNGPEEWGMVVTGGTNTNNFNESKQLKEGFTISSNMDVRDGKVTKSLSINATDDDVDTLATMLRNAGMGSHVSVNNQSDVCDDCGNPDEHCTCGMNQTAMCDACDNPLEDCNCGMTMENADHDYGHDEKSEIGEPLDVEDYVWDGPHLNQRFGKIGDNTLMAERAITLFKNYSDQYTQMLAEADLDPSNAGFDSPLTANSRDEFDKDPFVDETPVDDGSRSPLSTVKRQDVMN